MHYLSSGQASVAMLGIVKLPYETHLETRLAGLCRMLSHRLHRLLLRAKYFLPLGHP